MKLPPTLPTMNGFADYRQDLCPPPPPPARVRVSQRNGHKLALTPVGYSLEYADIGPSRTFTSQYPFKADERALLCLLWLQRHQITPETTHAQSARRTERDILEELDAGEVLPFNRGMYILDKFDSHEMHNWGVNITLGWLEDKGIIRAREVWAEHQRPGSPHVFAPFFIPGTLQSQQFGCLCASSKVERFWPSYRHAVLRCPVSDTCPVHIGALPEGHTAAPQGETLETCATARGESHL